MTMRPGLRKFALTAHIVSSVGWLGAVASALGLGIVALTSQDAALVRSVYLALEQTGWSILLPLGIASLLTGLVQALGTKWGLFRHYWVIVKLGINVLAVVVLVMYMQTLGSLADLAAQPPPAADGRGTAASFSPVLHGTGALLLLLAAAGLSVYKPPGLTGYGWRKQREQRAVPQLDV